LQTYPKTWDFVWQHIISLAGEGSQTPGLIPGVIETPATAPKPAEVVTPEAGPIKVHALPVGSTWLSPNAAKYKLKESM
jgi:hypothetical protein